MSDELDDELEFESLEDDRPGLDDLDDLDDLDVDDDEEDDDDDDEDYPEDATEEDIDLVLALYREEGAAQAMELDIELANDLDALIAQLRRIPGDAGALAMISLANEVFVLVRVRGKTVQVFCSDVVTALDWPICRDVVDFLGEELPVEDDESAPVGDADILADAGLREFDLESIAENYDEDAPELLAQIAKKIQFGPQFQAIANL
ncbi:MAG: tRNA adenosine deaminase-associated protein [Propionibacteriaceae bacterium]|nr:tRNA adenosine deaminase-associated protein [Propionibacteriaceae bacterium]